MVRYVTRRMGQTFLAVLIASVGIFAIIRLVPGDPAVQRAGVEATPEDIEALREAMGLNDPIPVAYVSWIRQVATGDFGISFTTGQPVTESIANVAAPTVVLLVFSLFLGVVVGILLGTIAAVTRRQGLKVSITVLVSILYGMPSFWLGLLTILTFSLWLGWLPTGGYVSFFDDPIAALRSLAMPVAVLALVLGSVISRFVQAALGRVLNEDYIRTAKAKGVPTSRVITRHALRTALIPVITVIGLQFGALLGGAVVIESVFTWPGMGRLLVQSVIGRDYPTVQAVLLLLVVTFAVVNLVTDLAYGLVDPRIRMRIAK